MRLRDRFNSLKKSVRDAFQDEQQSSDIKNGATGLCLGVGVGLLFTPAFGVGIALIVSTLIVRRMYSLDGPKASDKPDNKNGAGLGLGLGVGLLFSPAFGVGIALILGSVLARTAVDPKTYFSKDNSSGAQGTTLAVAQPTQVVAPVQVVPQVSQCPTAEALAKKLPTLKPVVKVANTPAVITFAQTKLAVAQPNRIVSVNKDDVNEIRYGHVKFTPQATQTEEQTMQAKAAAGSRADAIKAVKLKHVQR